MSSRHCNGSDCTDSARGRRTNLKVIPPRSSLRYTETFSEARLSALRLRGDPPADAVAEALHQAQSLTQIHDLLTTTRARARPHDPTCPLQRFLTLAAAVPAWVRPALIARGQRVHCTLYPFQGLSLFSGSLVGGSQFSNAAVVTALAGNITSQPTRRIRETGALLAGLALPGSLLHPGGIAHDSFTRVRLLHAALRHWLPRSGRLAPQRELVPARVYVEGEVPLNQHDLAITLGVFCYLNLRSLRRMDVVLSSADVEAYVHMWRYAGHVLGIEEWLLPVTLEDQEAVMLASMIHQGAPDHINGAANKAFINAFARQLAAAVSAAPVPGLRLHASTVQEFLEQMVLHLNGAEYTGGMGLQAPPCAAPHWAVRLTRALGWAFGTVLPRYVPGAEEALFRLHSWGIRREMKLRGTAVGHAAGSGKGGVGQRATATAAAASHPHAKL